MNFNRHSNVEGKHAFLGASNYHWINYSLDKLKTAYTNSMATQKGIQYHDLARKLIILNERLPKSRKTLNMYVNDAIGYKMTPEQVLYYSENCFGTADAISFSERDNILRIHDLKTGITPVHIEQLEVYAALFCLEYRVNPKTIKIELRIYQNNEIIFYAPEGDEISEIMKKIQEFDKAIGQMKKQEV